jgi:chemotaxis protein MotB
MLKRKKKSEDGAHDNLDRWLLTYSDLITLLLGLFVILYAMSNIDAKKYQQMAEALGEVFGSTKGTGILPGNANPQEINKKNDSINAKPGKYDTLRQNLASALKNIPESEGVTFEETQFGLVMHFKERLMFELGKADLRPGSIAILTAVADELKKLPNEILVEGHTDTIPIHNQQFQSNMHLSVYRAMNTGLFLTEVAGLDRDKISVKGYGEYRPLVPNTSDENRAQNRRVDIVIVNQEGKKNKIINTQ